MVRLKAEEAAKAAMEEAIFQFHYGTIKSLGAQTAHLRRM